MNATGESILVESLDERWAAYRIQFKTCQRAFSEEAVHDLRVAARRFLAVLDIIRDLTPRPHIQKTRRLFKDQLDQLDELRDVQVMLVEVLEALPRRPQLEIFRSYLEGREKRLLRAARRQAKASHLSELKKRVDKVRTNLAQQSGKDTSSSALLYAVDDAYARAKQACDQLDAKKVATIHQTRIAFKKFRYMAEIVYSLLPAPEPDYLLCMHDYQSTMGDIRDIAVLLDAMADVSRENTLRLDQTALRHYFRRRMSRLIADFLKEKNELNQYWRAAPAQPFPWEKA